MRKLQTQKRIIRTLTKGYPRQGRSVTKHRLASTWRATLSAVQALDVPYVMSLPRWFLVAVLLAIGVSAQAQQWKWRDANGKITVSDLPPPREVAEKDILQRPNVAPRYVLPPAAASAASAAASGAAPRVDPELEARRKRGEQEQEAKKKEAEAADAAAKAANCSAAKEQLRTMESGQRVARINEKGEREIMTDAERAAEAQRAQAIAQEKNLSPAAGLNRPEFLEGLRAARNRINSGNYWLFSPDVKVASHASRRVMKIEPGSTVLLATDGLLALASDYGAYSADSLMAAAMDKGLAALGQELRAIESSDSGGDKFPRFKKSDDATALLLRIV